MKSQKDKAIAFKFLHDRPGFFIIPNPWDPGTARLLTNAGFEALATTSAGVAFSLGRPDCNRCLSRDEILDNAKNILAVTELPVSADLENGYSDSPQGVFDTILLAGHAGLVGASIEDATGINTDPIYEFKAAVERIRAAAEAKKTFDFPFILTARAENFIHGRPDLNDTICRLQAFQEAGADVLYAPGLKSRGDISSLVRSLDKPVNVLTGGALTIAELAEIGVRRISLGSALIRASLGELLRAASEIKDKGTWSFADKAIPYDELNEIFNNRD
ncbi:MAG: isocitrate lyase/phosphoenolpyruvate mutase family protein [Ferruginibacter sp.]